MEEKTKRRKIYLSLPISGYDLSERRKTSLEKQRELETMGFQVLNPLFNGLAPDAGTNAHMKRDIEMLLGCDAIYLMRRFTHSAGCMTEFHIATAIGLDVYFEDCYAIEECVKFK